VKTKIFYVAMALLMALSLVGVAAGVAAPATPVKAAATTWYVDDTCEPPGDGTAGNPYCLIQTAIDAAAPGDTVVVNQGDYSQCLEIYKSLTLMSSSGDWRNVRLASGGSCHGITISGRVDVTVEGFEIHDFQDGIHIENIQDGGSVTIKDCFIHYNSGAGIWGDSLDGLLRIEGCIIADNGGILTGVHLEDVGSETTGGTVVITDSVIGAWYDVVEEESYSGNAGDGIKVVHVWPKSTVTVGEGGHGGWMFSGDNTGPDNVIAWNDNDGIDVEYLDGSLTIAGNAIGGWDFDLSYGESDSRAWGNLWDGIRVYRTRPGSSAVICDNAISENGFDSDGIEMEYVDGSLEIRNNIIGAWTRYEYDGAVVAASEDFAGNIHNGIYLSGVEGTVVIDSNKMAGNGSDDGDGIYIGYIAAGDDEYPVTHEPVFLRGSVTISNNDIGEWTDAEEETHEGNQDDGISINGVNGGCTLAIGPNNGIVDNDYIGIDLEFADGGADVTIFDNTIERNGTGYVGIDLYDCHDVTVDGNTISQHWAGIALWGQCAGNAIINNAITSNMGDDELYGIGILIDYEAHHNGIVGNRIADNGDGIIVEGDHNDILCNVITGNLAGGGGPACGVHFGGGAWDNVLNHNNIVGNGEAAGSYGVFTYNSDQAVDARWNWWGHSSGPYNGGTNPGGEGDRVSSYVDYTPWATSPFGYDGTPGDYDTAAPDILTAVAVPDMISLYTAIEEWTGDWWHFAYEEEFGFTPGPGNSTYLVETTDILEDGAQPRGIRYVTLDLEGAVAQFLGVGDLSQVQPPEWVIGPEERGHWLESWHRYLSLVSMWERMDFDEGCPRPAWVKEAAFQFRLKYLYWLYFDWSAGYSKLFEMMEPGEFQIGVTVEDWTGNTRSGHIDLAVVDVALPLEQGWNLRSTPIDLGVDCWGDIATLGEGLEYAIAYRFDSVNQKWEQVTNASILSPLDGIAVKATGRDAIGLVFDRNATPKPARQVNVGWNLIGLAAGPPYDPWMAVDDALTSIEEMTAEGRGYIIAESPRQYLQYEEEYVWCGHRYLGGYHWYFGQEEWTYLHPGADRPQPAPNMGIGGAQWVFMERDDTLAGFSSTPVFLNLLVERGEDLPDVPRYPATTMVFDMDWTEDWTWEAMPPGYWGLQWQALVYKGSFSPEAVLDYYEDLLPDYGWRMGSKFYNESGNFGPIYGSDASGIGFWKPAEHGGVPYFTDTVRILAFEMDGISFIAIIYVPVDVPTLPGTELILWESAWPMEFDLYMEFQGQVVPAQAIGDFTAAAGALQWELYELDELTWWAAFADFEKPLVAPLGEEWMELDVDFWFPGNDGYGWPWNIDQTVVIEIERRGPEMGP